MAFEEHADADQLRALAAGASGPRAARRHLRAAAARLDAYFSGASADLTCTIDWSRIDPASVPPLVATLGIPYGTRRPYTGLELESDHDSRRLGRALGANPIALLAPCHRVTRGLELPTPYVGGSHRRAWLDEHERRHVLD